MNPKRSWVEYWKWSDKLDDTYGKYSMTACLTGFDWDNDPPPLKILDIELCIADVQNVPLRLNGNIDHCQINICKKSVNVYYIAHPSRVSGTNMYNELYKARKKQEPP